MVYGKVIIERVQRLTEEKLSEEQGGFRKGRGCIFFQDGSRKNKSKRKKNTVPSRVSCSLHSEGIALNSRIANLEVLKPLKSPYLFQPVDFVFFSFTCGLWHQ